MSNKTNNYQIAGDTDVTSTGNIDDLDVKGFSLVRMNNASDATIRGIRAGYPGQIITFVSVGAGNVFFAHQNSGSSAANRLINFVTSGNTPLAAGVGTAVYQYDASTARWRLIDHNQGKPITVTFSAGDFTGSGSMTWDVASGDILVDVYEIKGRMLFLQFGYNTTTVGGTASSELRKTFPNGYTCAARGVCTIRQSQDGNLTFTQSFGLTQTSANTYVGFFVSVAQPNWTLTTNQTLVEGSAFFAIN